MHIINDFFLLTWNQKESSHVVFDEEVTKILSHNYDHDTERFCDSVAITLIVYPENFEAIAQLESSKQILNKLFSTLPFTKENIQKAQKTVLYFLVQKGNLAINRAITQRFERLRKEEILSYDVSRRLMSFLSLIEEKKEEKRVQTPVPAKVEAKHMRNFDYHEQVRELVVLAQRLEAIVQEEGFRARIIQTMERLHHARFSIGITGVMNAGKSTMLNALLGQELLGTSVVPETANLTVIGYAKMPYAKVNFWTKAQWESIEHSASNLGSMEAFVRETKAHFAEQLEAFITPEGKSENIKLDELGLYTSAKASDKKCNLVKSVELYTDLTLLEEGVVIVDTPGLDDPVIQREEITLMYLNECDVLVHLMNAAQAATQKDVDFIIDALLYRKVAQLLIVITRIDAISKAELEEVIAYTKQSIYKRLEEHNKASMLEEIIAKLHFIPLAGKVALMHKLGHEAEALARGYTLEQTGMPHFEAYLRELLFGKESAKAKITLTSNRKELAHIALTCKASLEEERALLLLSKEELHAHFEAYQHEKKAIESFLESIFAAIEQCHKEMQNYLSSLHLFAQHKMDALGRVLYRRIMDDVTYERSKYKRLPKEERIAYMVENGLKDGLLDVIRDYRYEFQKKMERLLEGLSVQYEAFQTSAPMEPFDAKVFCEAQFSKTVIFKNNSVVIAKINQAITKDGKKGSTLLDKQVEESLKEEIEALSQTLWQTLSALNDVLLSSFTQHIHSPALEIQTTMERKGETLQNMMEKLHANSLNESVHKEELEKHLASIEEILEGLHAF